MHICIKLVAGFDMNTLRARQCVSYAMPHSGAKSRLKPFGMPWFLHSITQAVLVHSPALPFAQAGQAHSASRSSCWVSTCLCTVSISPAVSYCRFLNDAHSSSRQPCDRSMYGFSYDGCAADHPSLYYDHCEKSKSTMQNVLAFTI